MSRDRVLSRRAVLSLVSGLAAAAARPVAAQTARDSDRGVGGTGAVPPLPTGDDRGIGGTGVIGTIRRFGSIVVNGLRITFPPSVAVSIDERPAVLKDLKLGHVVQVLARGRAGRLTTWMIAADSQVVGPIEAIATGRMVVLGQDVAIPAGVRPRLGRIGDMVAVSGLRRIDGVVVASLIEPRPADTMRVAGPIRIETDGTLRIGALVLAGLSDTLAGRSVTVIGRLDRGVFHVERTLADPFARFGAKPSRLSIETYAAHDRGRLYLGSGLSIAAPAAVALALDQAAPARVVISAAVAPDGEYRVQSLRVEVDGHDRHNGDGHGLDRAHPAGPGTEAPGPVGAPRGPAPSGSPKPGGSRSSPTGSGAGSPGRGDAGGRN